MTIDPLDPQPAPRPRNVSARGGRLTKFKGQVASIAPGLLVLASAAVMFSGSAAQADNECGSPTNGVVFSCGAGTYNNGIKYTDVPGYRLNLNNVTVNKLGAGQGVQAKGVEVGGNETDAQIAARAVRARNSTDIVVNLNSGTISTEAVNGMGIIAEHVHLESNADTFVNVGTSTPGVVTRITTNGKQSHGAVAGNKGGGNARVVMEGEDTKINITGKYAIDEETGNIVTQGRGLWATITNTGRGSATVEMKGGEITTDHTRSFAIYSSVKNQQSDAMAKATMSGGEIITKGHRAYGMWVETAGTGRAEAIMTGGKITTEAATDEASATRLGLSFKPNNTYGIWAFIEANATIDADKAVALAKMSGGEIITKSDVGFGIVASSNGSGTVKVKVTSDSKVTTEGKDAHAVYAWSYNRGNKTATAVVDDTASIETSGDGAYGVSANHTVHGAASVEMHGGTVTTKGKEAHGLNAFSASATASVHLSGIVTVSGEDADGIRAEGATGFDISVNGSVTGGTGNGAAIRTISRSGLPGVKREIRINGNAVVNGTASGLAIEDGDGDTTIDSWGEITGDIRLGAGDDTLKLNNGSFTGDIYAGAGNDTVAIHTVTLGEGRYILDGGVGGNDKLTFVGSLNDPINMNSTETHLSNWERVEVDMGLSIDATSTFRATGREGGTPTGAMIAGQVATASGGGLTIAGDVINDGSVILDVQDGATGDVITIDGDYTGSGRSVFALDTVIDGNGADTDQLVITGDISGEMMLSIAGLDSAGAADAPLVMDVVTVGRASEGTFTLMDGNYVTADGEHAFVSGAYLYRLAEARDGGGWALSALSESGEVNYQPSAPLYDSYGQALLAMNGPASLRNRGSSQDFRSLAWDDETAGQDPGSPLWIQMGTEQLTSSEEQSTTGAALESSLWEMEIGADLTLNNSTAGLLVGGLMVSYGTGSTAVTSTLGDGSIETSGLGLSLAGTWYDARRFYVDGQVTMTSYTSDLTADRFGTLIEDNSGTGFALSMEAGQEFDLGTGMTVVPQAQLSFSSVGFDDFEGERYGEQVTFEDATSQQLRLGLEFGAQEQGANGLYGIVNLYHEFGAGSEVDVAGTSLTTEGESWAVGAGLGGSYALTERVDLFGEAAYATGLSNAGDTSALSANAGIKMLF